MTISFVAVPGIGDIVPGEDLAQTIGDALANCALTPVRRDIIVVAQKAVSKAEGRFVDLSTVVPSAYARAMAAKTGKDPRLVELILSESEEVVRAKPGVIVVAHRQGYVMAQAGIDHSNVGCPDQVLLLPADCDTSAATLRSRLEARFRVELGVIISDSFGRAWRKGTVNVALGVSGLPAVIDRRGDHDRYGRPLESTEIAFADAVAGGAGIAMGEAAEGMPVVLARGLDWNAPEQSGAALIRSKTEDMFR